MTLTSATRFDLAGAILESSEDNVGAREIVTTTDDNGVVQIVPNAILQTDGSRLSNVPIDRLLALLLDAYEDAVPREGTNEDLGLVTELLAANQGGEDAAFKDLRKLCLPSLRVPGCQHHHFRGT